MQSFENFPYGVVVDGYYFVPNLYQQITLLLEILRALDSLQILISLYGLLCQMIVHNIFWLFYLPFLLFSFRLILLFQLSNTQYLSLVVNIKIISIKISQLKINFSFKEFLYRAQIKMPMGKILRCLGKGFGLKPFFLGKKGALLKKILAPGGGALSSPGRGYVLDTRFKGQRIW